MKEVTLLTDNELIQYEDHLNEVYDRFHCEVLDQPVESYLWESAFKKRQAVYHTLTRVAVESRIRNEYRRALNERNWMRRVLDADDRYLASA